MKSCFEYLDYRAFLRDWFEEAKAKRRGVSFRWFSARAGITSPVFPKLVMDGQRNLGDAGAEGFANAMGLKGKERSYWMHLVAFNQAKTSLAKQEQYSVLSGLALTIPEKSLGHTAFRYYAKWYHAVLRELATLRDFRNDWETLAQWVRPAISAQDAKEGMQTLEEMGLLIRNKKGLWEQTDKAITSGNDLARKSLLEFHRTMLANSAQALDNIPKAKRHVSALTLGVSQGSYDAILVEYEAFRNRVLRLVHQDADADRVVHMGFQLIPVAMEPSREGEGL